MCLYMKLTLRLIVSSDVSWHSVEKSYPHGLRPKNPTRLGSVGIYT